MEQTIRSIRLDEIYFPKTFASFTEREYGILYYMDDNRDSYDGNHAFIFPDRINDLGAVIDDITGFYKDHGIRALIYHPHEKDYFRKNEQILNAHGFEYTYEPDHRVMLLNGENTIRTEKRLDIRVLDSWDERVASDILIPSGEPWEVDVTRRRTEYDGTYLIIGYIGGRAVVYTDIHKTENDTTRFDYIVTAKSERGKGYASELVSFTVDYCRTNNFPICWQWAGPSENICCRAGFTEVFTVEAGYAWGPVLNDK
nr:GNAT family N-acetyltransferase [Clostridia bacterium]